MALLISNHQVLAALYFGQKYQVIGNMCSNQKRYFVAEVILSISNNSSNSTTTVNLRLDKA